MNLLAKEILIMNDYPCRSCLFYDKCQNRIGCDNYAPAGEDAEDEALDTYIEERRREFHEEWYEYTSEDFE